PARRPTLRDRERRLFRRTPSRRPGPQEHDTNSQNRLTQAWPLGRRRINDWAGPELTQNSVIHLNKRVSLRPAEGGLPSACRRRLAENCLGQHPNCSTGGRRKRRSGGSTFLVELYMMTQDRRSEFVV